MCGIAGCAVAEGEQVDPAALERMARALGHRGPDDSNVEIHGRVGLVATRLAIVDPGNAGRQPMRDPSGRWVLAYNGEIYNHDELRRNLPGPFVGHSDTETLVHALGAWDDGAVARCNGIFAFAALDCDRQRLLLVRDHLGIKPLYIARTPRALWFASEIKALLAAGIPPRPRLDELAITVAKGWPPGTVTLLDGIDRLCPGTIRYVDLATLTTQDMTWYDLGDAVDPARAAELAACGSDALVDRLHETLRSAVRRQLMSDVPVGVLCSGGIDSSLITALAHEGKPDVSLYTASLVGAPRDEVHWAVKVGKELGIDAKVVPITADTWRRTVVSSVCEYEYAYGGGMVPISALARRAHADGCKVVLTGEGSDELFGGYGLNPGWRSAWSLLPWAKRPRWVVEQVRSIGLGSARARLWERFGPRRPDLLPPGSRRGDAVREETMRSARLAYGHHEGARRELEAAFLTSLTAGTLPGLLNRMDKNAMGASVEARVPYLDREVISLVVNLPAESRIGPPPKHVLREVVGRYLPSSVANRPKQAGTPIDVRAYFAPADADFLDHGRMRDLYEIPLDSWRRALASLPPAVFTRTWFAEIWCRLFLEGQSVRTVEDALWPAGVDA